MRRLQPQDKAKKRKSHELHCRGLQERLKESQCHGLIRACSGVPPPTACCRPVGHEQPGASGSPQWDHSFGQRPDLQASTPQAPTAWAGQWLASPWSGVVRWLRKHSGADSQPQSYPVADVTSPAVPTWPTPEGRRTITVELPSSHLDHLDQQASYEGMSRAAYIRQLIRRDIERQGPVRHLTAQA